MPGIMSEGSDASYGPRCEAQRGSRLRLRAIVRIGGGLKQSSRSGAEQDGVNLSRILKRQPTDLRRQGEHDVEIRDRQKLGFALRQPSGASLSLALGTVPVSARVI